MHNKISNTYPENFLENLVAYTPDQIEGINNITHVEFMGRISPIEKDSLYKYSTIKGLQEQLDSFVLRHGIIYYISFLDDTIIQMSKHHIELSAPPMCN